MAKEKKLLVFRPFYPYYMEKITISVKRSIHFTFFLEIFCYVNWKKEEEEGFRKGNPIFKSMETLDDCSYLILFGSAGIHLASP